MDNQLLNLDKGREYYMKGDFKNAEPLLREAAKTFENYADVMNMLGVIMHDKGDIKEAQSFFERAFEINPRYTEAAINLAVTYNEQGLYKEARKVHEQTLNLKSATKGDIEPFALGKLTNMHAALGEAYAELKMMDRAAAQYREALTLNPGFVDIRTKFAQMLRDNGDYLEAIVQFKLVLEQKPTYLPAIISLGSTYFAMNNKKSAHAMWQKAITLDPENRTAQMYLRMVDQIIALEDAEASGLNIDVTPPENEQTPDDVDEASDLRFSYDDNA